MQNLAGQHPKRLVSRILRVAGSVIRVLLGGADGERAIQSRQDPLQSEVRAVRRRLAKQVPQEHLLGLQGRLLTTVQHDGGNANKRQRNGGTGNDRVLGVREGAASVAERAALPVCVQRGRYASGLDHQLLRCHDLIHHFPFRLPLPPPLHPLIIS